jgi:hypothetical protein
MTSAVAVLAALFFQAAASDAAPHLDAGVSPDGPEPIDASDATAPRSDAAADATTPPIAQPLATQRGRIVGRVFARGSRKAVAGATVTVDLDELGETDSEGRIDVEAPCGSRHVRLQAPGFESVVLERNPCAGAPPLVVRLVPRAGAAGFETVVRAPSSRQEVRLQGEELVRTPGTFGDPFRAVESLPGVTTVAWPAAIYAVRGSNPGDTGFFLDELPVPALFHFALGPSVIHPYFFQDLDFYAGGYPARYGRYVAGIVAAHTRAAPSDDVHASVDVRLFDAGAMVTAPLPGNGAVAVAGRYSFTGAVVGLLSTAGVDVGYWDYQLRGDRAFGPVRLTLLAFGSNDTLTTSTSTIALRFHRAKLRADVPAFGGHLSASLALGTDRSEAPLVDDVPIVVSDVSALPRLSFTRPTSHADFELGFDGILERFAPVTMLERVQATDLGQRRTVRLLAAYASAVVRAGPRLVLTPELRLDSYQVDSTTNTWKADLGPRISGRYAISDRTWIKASGGRFTQLPSLPLQVPGAQDFGLALYGLQSSWQGAVGVGTTRFAGLDASVTGYVQRYVLTDLRDPVVTRMLDPLSDDYLVRRDALSYGAELLVRRSLTERLHGWLSYTLSWNERALGGGVIGPSDWDQRHVANLVLGYRWRNYVFGGRAHFNTGRPVLVSSAAGETFQRLPPFYQIDLRVDRRILFDKFAIDGYLELVNATLSRQVVGLVQSMPGSPPTEDAFRIVLPSLGLHGEF